MGWGEKTYYARFVRWGVSMGRRASHTFGTFGDGRRVDPGVADRFDLNEKRFNLPTGMNDAMPLNNIYSILHALKKTNF